MNEKQKVTKRKSYKRRPTMNQSIKLNKPHKFQIMFPMIKEVKEKLRILEENWR